MAHGLVLLKPQRRSDLFCMRRRLAALAALAAAAFFVVAVVVAWCPRQHDACALANYLSGWVRAASRCGCAGCGEVFLPLRLRRCGRWVPGVRDCASAPPRENDVLARTGSARVAPVTWQRNWLARPAPPRPVPLGRAPRRGPGPSSNSLVCTVAGSVGWPGLQSAEL